MNKFTLLVRCDDRTGIVAALSDFVFRNNGNILEADQYSDVESDSFFMRLTWKSEGFALDKEGVRAALLVLSQRYSLEYNLQCDTRKQRVAIFCSSTPHCLHDLLLRQEMGELPCEIPLIISNHTALEKTAKHFNIPFHYLPITKDTKQNIEKKQEELLRENEIDLIVLARYMQILSSDFINEWQGKAINIHHSFLPAFVGAKPYHQAKKRGVKIIGATAHYVTADLDEGPIIEQDVNRVSHHDEVDDLVRIGRDLERQVLSTAVRLHLEQRIVVDKNRTIIFR